MYVASAEKAGTCWDRGEQLDCNVIGLLHRSDLTLISTVNEEEGEKNVYMSKFIVNLLS